MGGQLYEKWAVSTTVDQTPLGVSTLKNLWSLPVSFVIMTCTEDLAGMPAAFRAVDLPSGAFIAASGVGCFALSLCYMTLYKISSATSITIASNLNKVLTILLGSL